MSEIVLHRHRAIWLRKPLLQAIYTEWYKEMCSWLVPGRTLEVGGGSGNFKEWAPDVISTDIVPVPWLDSISDAHNLCFRSESFSNIVVFDVLHHLENPVLFIHEALRVLRPGGRLVIMEPYVSWLSYPLYRFLHPEPLDLSTDPFQLVPHNSDRIPFQANQGIPTLLFDRHWCRFRELYPSFTKLSQQWVGILLYPLSGGFDHSSFIPFFLYRPLRWIEKCLAPFGRFLAFRFIVVLGKLRAF